MKTTKNKFHQMLSVMAMTFLCFCLTDCQKDPVSPGASYDNGLVVVTTEITDVTTTSAKGGGSVTSENDVEVSARGVCWSKEQSPMINDDHTTDGMGTGEFTSTITGLMANSTYYVRAYATVGERTYYGGQKSFMTTAPSTTDPTISVLDNAGYLTDGCVIALYEEYPFGFVAMANEESGAELASLVVTLNDEEYDNLSISGTNYTYEGRLSFSYEGKEIVDEVVVKAVVTDVYGRTGSTSFTISINIEEEELVPYDFSWYRLGNHTQTGLEEFGLYWESNMKDVYAQIKPLDGVTLFIFDPSVWSSITTMAEKTALFETAIETMYPVSVYNNVSVSYSGSNYDDVIGTVMPDGEKHLMHITRCEAGASQAQGIPFTIYGTAL